MSRGRQASGCIRLRPVLVSLLAFAVAAVGVGAAVEPASFLYLVYIGVSLVLGLIAATTLVWMLHAWRTPQVFAESRFDPGDLEPAHSFSLIVPARHEEAVLEVTLTRLIKSDHPDFEVLVVVGADDPATREVAERMAGRRPELVKVVIDSSWPKSKPKALNAALPFCAGTITGVFDAEDDVHPVLLRRVDQCFQRTDADVVQAGVQLMNFRSRWWTVHNVLEYYFWFRSRLHLHARQRFIPLGGNTVFIRTQVLRAVAGWDPDCLAEDCELGVRLSALGARTVVFYEPELVTREECPPTAGAFVRQRTRWNQGYLQTLSRGYWRRLPIRQRALGVYILAMPFVMTLAWLLIPVAIGTAVAVKAPVPITMISFIPALPMLSMLVIEAAGLGEFCRTYGEPASMRDYARLVLGLPFYQAVLSFAAARAVAREARGARGWEKTAHLGLHLMQPADEEGARPAALLQELSGRPQHAGAELRAAALTGSRIGPSGQYPHAYGYLGGLPAGTTAGAGNGRRVRYPPRLAEFPSVRINGEPLWVRLDGAPPDGPARPPGTPAPGGARATGRLLGGVRRGLARLAKSRVDLAVQLVLLTGLGLVQWMNMLHWPAVLFDEGTYVGNAWAVEERGRLAFYTYTYGHPPLAWVFISIWTWAGGLFRHSTYSLDSGRELMGAVSIVSFSLLYILARRLAMRPAFAAAAVILFALSPLALFFHRGVLLDNPATVWVIAAFVLALSPRHRLWSFAASGACFAASVLSKETTLVLLPALGLAAIQNTDRRTRRYCLALFGSFSALIGLAFPLYAALKGELLPGKGHVSLIGTEINMLFTRQGTGSVFNPHSVAHGTVTFWLSLDSRLLAAALLLSPIALARRKTRAIALAYLIQVLMVLRPGYLPAMYVIALLPFAALIVASSIEALWCFAARGHLRRQLPAGQPMWWVIWHRAAAVARRVAVTASAAAVAVAAVIAVLDVAPRWAHADYAAMTLRLDGPQREAQQWLIHHAGHEQRLIVTDDVWVYLIEHGFDSHPVRGGFNSRTVVSYWPLDKDPAVKRYFPYGWREFDYIVSNAAMRDTAIYTPSTAQALQHSRPVAIFGRGGQRIEIRAIMPTPVTKGPGITTGMRQYRVPATGTAPSLNRVARALGVSVNHILSYTNRYAESPEWWYYEAKHNYKAPLPPGVALHYTKG